LSLMASSGLARRTAYGSKTSHSGGFWQPARPIQELQ
jgi:hypothetical protein